MINNRAYDVYSSTRVKSVDSLALQNNQAKITLEVSQYFQRYQDKFYTGRYSSQRNNSGRSQRKFNFTLQLENDTWKISNVKIL